MIVVLVVLSLYTHSFGRVLLCSPQGNKAGLVGCGFYNNNCGGLDMGAAWEAVYISIAILAVVVFPFLIFMYEADDEGLTAMKAGAGKIGQLFNAAQCTKAILSALCYELILLVIAIPILMITWTYLGVSWIPVSATTIDARSGNAFYPSTWGLQWACVCVCVDIVARDVGVPATVQRFQNSSTVCGTGKCLFVAETLKMEVCGGQGFVLAVCGTMHSDLLVVWACVCTSPRSLCTWARSFPSWVGSYL
jgi:hypothetical protein